MAGETTATTAKNPPVALPAGLFVVPLSAAFSDTQNQLADVMEMGFVPANCTVLGLLYKPTDMDTNVSPTLVHKVTVGSTDVATGLTGAQTGAGSFVPTVPTTVTTKSKVTVTSSTAAATAAAGTLYLGVLCQR